MTVLNISELLHPKLIDLEINHIEFELIFAHLLQLANQNHLIADLKAVHDDFHYIRKLYSMAIGDGVILPYIRSHHVTDNFICFGRTKSPLDMAAVDGEPIRFVVLCGSLYHDYENQILILAKLHRLMKIRQFRMALSQCHEAEKVIQTFKQREQFELEYS